MKKGYIAPVSETVVIAPCALLQNSITYSDDYEITDSEDVK